jgi:farnesyl diphosphate synthase
VKIAETDFQAWMGGIQARMESVLARLLPAAHVAPARLHEAMRYATLEGGKRVRPLLAFAAGEVCGAAPERLEIAAAAVELIHAYSLVHDDLPCMDDDVLRRGKPTVHVEYNEATALLVGDALQSLAFQLLSENRLADDPRLQLEMIKTLAVAAGSRGMAGGQQIDLEATGKTLTLPELEFMHIHKTGALIRAAVTMGSACGRVLDEREKSRLDRYAKAIGLAFQVVDDVLDYDASTATLGKTAGKDSRQGKPTYVSAMGLARARELAERLRGEAHAALADLGAPARRLGEVADFIVLRKF